MIFITLTIQGISIGGFRISIAGFGSQPLMTRVRSPQKMKLRAREVPMVYPSLLARGWSGFIQSACSCIGCDDVAAAYP